MNDKGPPYLDWTIDRWKVAVIVITFAFVLGGLLWGPGG